MQARSNKQQGKATHVRYTIFHNNKLMLFLSISVSVLPLTLTCKWAVAIISDMSRYNYNDIMINSDMSRYIMIYCMIMINSDMSRYNNDFLQ